VTVVLTVTQAAPSIQLSATGLSVTAVAGGAQPPPPSFTVGNSGAGSLSWTAQATTLSGGQLAAGNAGIGNIGQRPAGDGSLRLGEHGGSAAGPVLRLGQHYVAGNAAGRGEQPAGGIGGYERGAEPGESGASRSQPEGSFFPASRAARQPHSRRSACSIRHPRQLLTRRALLRWTEQAGVRQSGSRIGQPGNEFDPGCGGSERPVSGRVYRNRPAGFRRWQLGLDSGGGAGHRQRDFERKREGKCLAAPRIDGLSGGQAQFPDPGIFNCPSIRRWSAWRRRRPCRSKLSTIAGNR